MAFGDGTIPDDSSSGSDDLSTTLNKAQQALSLDTGNLDDPRITKTPAPAAQSDDYSSFRAIPQQQVPQLTAPEPQGDYVYQGYGTTFADEHDLIAYRQAKASGATEEQALLVGDNGVGNQDLGSISTSSVYGVAVPRWQLVNMFGEDPSVWRKARALVKLGDRTALVPIVDEGPGNHAQASGVVTDMTGPLAKYMGSTGHDPVTVSYQTNAGPDYMTDRDAWNKEQAKFGAPGGYGAFQKVGEEKASGGDYSAFKPVTPSDQYNNFKPVAQKEETVAPRTGNWIGDEVNKIWKVAQAAYANQKLGAVTSQAHEGVGPNDPFELEIQQIKINPDLNEQQKLDAINAMRANQARAQQDLKSAVPGAQAEAKHAQEEAVKSGAGPIEEFTGGLVPYAVTGAVGGKMAPFLMAQQATAQTYGEVINDAASRLHKLRPDLSDAQIMEMANKAAVDAAKAAGISQLALGLVNLPVAGPLVSRIAGKLGVGAATLEVANIYSEVQKDISLKENVDPNQKIGERLKDLDFHLTNIFGGALFALPHGVAEIGKGEPGVVTVGEPGARSFISNRQVIYPPNILNEKLGAPDDEQTKATAVEENGETTSEPSGTGDTAEKRTTAPEEKPSEKPVSQTGREPVKETEGAKTDLEEPTGRKTPAGTEPEAKGDTGTAGTERGRLYDRGQSVSWSGLDTGEKTKVVMAVRRLIVQRFNDKFSGIAKALGIDLNLDPTRKTAATFSTDDFKVNVNPSRLAQQHYATWIGGGMHWSRPEMVDAMLQEELMHGAYYRYVYDKAQASGMRPGELLDKYDQAITKELQDAAKAARKNNDAAGAEILEKAQEHSLTLYHSAENIVKPGFTPPYSKRIYTFELIRQLMQIRERGRMTEAWYRPLWERIRRDYIQPAIKTLRNLAGRINPTDTPTLWEVVDGAEKLYRQTEKPPNPIPPSEIDASGGTEVNFPGEEFILPTREVVEKQPHTEELIKAWDEFRDKQRELHGMWAQLNKIYKQIRKYDKNFPLDVDGIGKQLDKNPSVTPIIPKGIRQWLNAANNGLYRHIGTRMKAGGYETVMPDQMIRKWIGAPDDVIPFPRILRPDVRKVMEGALRDPKTGNFTKAAQELYNEGVREGIFTQEKDLEDWAATYRRVYTADSDRPKLTNLERARTAKFPKFFYTYSPESMLDSLFWQSTEIARLEAFGQKISGFKLDKDGNKISYSKQDLFDRTISAIESDTSLSSQQIRHAISSIDSLRKIAYGLGWRGALTRSIRGLSSFGLAGSPHTSAKIWTSMFFNVPQYRGLGRTLQGIWDHTFGGQHHNDVLELQRLGLKQDVPINIYDDPYTTKTAQQRAQEFFTLGLKVAGHALAQDNAKAITARISRMWIRDAMEQLRSDPSMLKARTRMIAQDIERRGLNPQIFAQASVDPKIVDRFVAEDVNDIQTAYRPEDYPAWASTPMGSVLFQFGHWAYNSARTITRDSVLPIGEAFSKGDAMLGTRYLGRLMGVFMVSAGAEETWRWIDEHVFGRQPHVAVISEILQAMNKHDGGVALWMLSNRLTQDIIGSPVVGLYGDISQFMLGIGQGTVDTTHFFDPRNPAGVAYLNGFINAINTYTRQGFKLSGQQITAMGSQMAAIIKGYYDIVEPALGYFGVGVPGHNEAAGHREASWVRSRQDIFYKSTGYPDHRELGKGTTSPHTVYLQNINEALLAGNTKRAIEVKNKYKQEQKLDDETLKSSLRSSVNTHRPIPGGAAGKAFMKWALRDLPPNEIERMRHIDRVFRSTAQKAGIPISAGADQ